LLQTRDGYLWIGTGAGLVRFDGWHFHIFRIGNTPALLDDNCVALAEGADGAVWIGTERGGLLRWQNHRFHSWQAGRTNSSLTLAHNQVRALHACSNGNVWIGTANGLDLFRAGQFTHYTTANGLQANNIRAVLQDAQGAVWVGTEIQQYSGGLQRLEPGANHFETVPGQGTNLPFMVHCFLEDKDGAVWWGNNAGLHRRANGVTRDFHIADGLSGEVVRRLVPAGDGGLLVVNNEQPHVPGRRGFGRFKDGQMAAIGLAALGIDSELICALEDAEGNLWLGTRHDGLYRMQRRPVTAFTTREGLPSDRVNCLCATRHGTVYVATAAGLSAIRDNQVVTNLSEAFYANWIALAFAETRFGGLWLWVLQPSLALELREVPGLKTRFGTGHPTLEDHAPVSCLYADRDDGLWVGQRRGATRFNWGPADPSLGQIFRGDLRTNHVGNAPVQVITQDRAGAVWLGTQGSGLLRWQDGNLTSYTAAGGLGSDVVSSLFEDSEGALWIGTDSGLARFKDGHFARVSSPEGLPESVINQILQDDLGQLWCGGPRGIFRVSRAELNAVADGRQSVVRAVTYGEAEGMPSAEVSGTGQPLGGKSPDGRLWFVTLKGVVVIDPRTALDNPVPPPVIIEQVRANDAVVFGDTLGEITERGPWAIEYRLQANDSLKPSTLNSHPPLLSWPCSCPRNSVHGHALYGAGEGAVRLPARGARLGLAARRRQSSRRLLHRPATRAIPLSREGL
jgi:streptogramin lyase